MDTSITTIQHYISAANYLSALQIYLQDNFFLERKLTFNDIKPRLLGHWGTCPGINFVYGHLNYLIKKHQLSMIFILGPGHGFPALQANLFLEGTLSKYYPEITFDSQGIANLAKKFSWPYGFPSHSNPGAPGVIVEGGELGYALSTAYGAILDNPELIAACVIGDGEAETGATATAWHLNKFIDPATNGAVLPILHLNGYKISGPSIFGRMSKRELKNLFTGYGYQPYIVSGKNIDEQMLTTLEICYQKIRSLQTKAKSGEKIIAPQWPMIILKTPKGWTGIKKLHQQKLAGNCLSHQVIAANAKTDLIDLTALEKWLKSYNVNNFFSSTNGLNDLIQKIVPATDLCMGNNAILNQKLRPLICPNAETFTEDAHIAGTIGSSSMRRAGLYLAAVCKLNQHQRNFRLFSPDETYSNKLDAIFTQTKRSFTWPIKAWDKDIDIDGRVIEMLSEHSLQGLLQGYILTGRHGIFASYEAFIQIIASMTDQYIKFLRIARETPWRNSVPSLNYILTSSGWRQEHNGFSHQNPGFIANLLQKYDSFTHVYFPPDGNTTLFVLEKSLQSISEINVVVAGKTQEPRWLTPELAKKELAQGLMIWDFISDDNPDIVLGGIGDYVSKEAIEAIKIIKMETPQIKCRFVNILELNCFGFGQLKLDKPSKEFDDYFTQDKPVIFNFHGYPSVLQQLLFNLGNTQRFFIHGYIEQGSTTTPFDMHVRNKTSRWHLAKEIFTLATQQQVISNELASLLNKKYDEKLIQHRSYIEQYGVDPEE